MTAQSSSPTLLSPLDHGRLHLKNRVVFPAHQTLLSSNGVVGDRMLGYYLERARHGVAAVIVEGGAVHPTTLKFPEYLRFYDPAVIPGLDRLADALHEYDCKVIAQVAHSGSRMNTQDSRLPLWAPSDVRSANTHEIPHEMTRAEIAELIESYGHTAAVLGRTRVDGIEIHAAHEYLLSEFFSPLNNRRDDEYGGSLENRVRLAREVILRVRAVIGDDKVVGLRLNGSELIPGGLEPDDCAQIAHLLAATGALDYINVSAGRSSHNQAIVPPMDAPRALYADLADAIKQRVSIPVIAVGRIKTPAEAEAILEAGKADAVAIARSLIADPAWVEKAASSEPIRPCISCNQGCYGYMVTIRPISCTVNPSVGLEYLSADQTCEAEVTPSHMTPSHMVVIGGGPAGMEAAIGFATAGHRVTLLESSDRLGGQVRLASAIEARAEMSDIVDHQARELDRLGVEVRFGCRADVTTVLALEPDAVVVAIGSTPRLFALPTDDSIPVLSPHEFLANLTVVPTNGKVVVIDDSGHFPAYIPAELLVDAGNDVSLLTAKLYSGTALDPTTMETMLRRLGRKGVNFVTHSVPVSIADGALLVRDALSGRESRIACSLIVAALGNMVLDRLYHELVEATEGDVKVVAVGDCVAPRTALEAIREGAAVVDGLYAGVEPAKMQRAWDA